MQEYAAELLRNWNLPPYAWNLLIILASILIGLLLRFLLRLFVKKETADSGNFFFGRSLLRNMGKPLSLFIPLFVFDLLLPVMQLDRPLLNRLNHGVEIALIIVTSWALIRLVSTAQDLAHYRININTANNLRQRRIMTQLIYIRHVIVSIIILLTIGAVLLTFSTMRKIGTGLLTGVGIGGIIIGFAAQRSLGNLLAGFQIAFTQPIRIDDEVIVEGEFGKVEEITLTYVVVRIWDERRLVLPINYFIEKPFQNWTRKTSEMTGVVYLYADFTLPVEWLRAEFLKALAANPLWDKRVANMAVTNLKEDVMEIRAIMSCRSSGNAWDLRCAIRETLIQRINEDYPQCLPKGRTELKAS